MPIENLESAIERAGGVLPLLRNLKARAHTLPIVAEHTSWQAEQHAWRDACVLMDQSHHMTDLFISGPDALKLLTKVGVNSFKNFTPGKAKQLIVCNPDGYFIGDVILFHLPDGTFDLVGREIVMDWVQFNLETGGYDAVSERDDNSAVRGNRTPKLYRFEVQGPNAMLLMEKALGHPVPDIKFFNMTEFNIAGRKVQALRHGMAGRPGFELFGPWEDEQQVRSELIAAGTDYGLSEVGAKAYSTANLESGWLPPTLPAIYTGGSMKTFREWLPVDNLGALGGSLVLDKVEDYYLTPYDLGYDSVVDFDHDFIGREALEKVSANPPRTKVSLVWNPEDVTAVFSSLYEPGVPAKLINIPKARYAIYQKDSVLKDGKVVGVSMDCGYLANDQVMISLASVDRSISKTGTPVTIIWGEDPITQKVGVEPHRQVKIRATVAPAPYQGFARSTYRDR